jgi:CDP-diacylglycerol--serine O-phosphatidyltransferase
MFLAAEGRFNLAVYVLVVAILLDALDGRLARLLNATSEFGKEFDSFSDALSFGAAPAFLIQQAMLEPLGMVGYAAASIYLLAVVLRLARFNLTSDTHAKARRTTGMPCPIGAGYLMAAVLMRGRFEPIWAVALLLVMALLLVSRIKLPDLKGKSFVSAMLLVGMFNYFAVVFFPSWRTVLWWNIWNVLILLAAWIEDRRLAREPLQG